MARLGNLGHELEPKRHPPKPRHRDRGRGARDLRRRQHHRPQPRDQRGRRGELRVEPDGFLVEAAATGTLLARNLAAGWQDDGIDVNAAGTLLRRNTAVGNADLGFEAVPGIIDLGRNRARGNGNAFQCLNVGCR